jgi:hypothetical protein
MSATTPLWVPLTIAAVGLTTTVGAAVLTQWWASRREDVRWSRERNDRHEQWQREDSQRWHQDRQQAYARLIAALGDWDSTLSSAIAARTVDDAMEDLKEYTQLWPAEQDTAELDRKMRTVREALTLVEFMAPKAVRDLARQAVSEHQLLPVTWLRKKQPLGVSELRWRRGALERQRSELLAAMRENLGLEEISPAAPDS